MADARAAACLAVLLDVADQISETSPRVGRWSAEEHRLYVSGVGRYGKRWSVIASHVGTRTGTQVRSHAVRTVAGREGACTCTHSSPTRAWGSSRPPHLRGSPSRPVSRSRPVSPSSSTSLNPSLSVSPYFPLSHTGHALTLAASLLTLAATIAAKDQQKGGQANEHGDGINGGTWDPAEASMLWKVPSPRSGCPCRGPPGLVPARQMRVQAVRETRG